MKKCTVKRSCGSKRRPKVMTGIGRTHPTSGRTRHTTTFSLKKEVQVLSTPILSTRVPSDNSVRATASSSQPTPGGRGGDLPMVGLLNYGPTSQ